jgi:hypothetical protein
MVFKLTLRVTHGSWHAVLEREVQGREDMEVR